MPPQSSDHGVDELTFEIPPGMELDTRPPPTQPGNHPKRYWIVVDLEIPMVAWQLAMTGVFTSAGFTDASLSDENLVRYLRGDADNTPFIPNPQWAGSTMSPYMHQLRAKYIIEHEAERVRRLVDPLLPSRLTATYAFGTKKQALQSARAINRARADSGRLRPPVEVHQFELFSLPHLYPPLTRIHVANMHVISMLRDVITWASWSPTQLEGFFRHYWESKAELAVDVPAPDDMRKRQIVRSGVAWEYLIEGRLDRVGGPLGLPGSAPDPPEAAA